MGNAGVVYTSGSLKKRAKAHISKKSSEDSQLDHLAKKAEIVVFEIESLFPFDFFPKKLTICPNRITVSSNNFLSTYEIPLPIESVTGASVFHNLFFSSLSISTFGLEAPQPLTYLRKDEARTARRYILALIECKKNNVDLYGLSKKEIREKLLQIGKVRK